MNMNKTLITFVLIIAGLVSCKEENRVNKSNIRLYEGNNFRITSITPGSNGSIWCVGLKGDDTLLAHQYDASFNLLKSINLTETRGFTSNTFLQPNDKGGWLTLSTLEESYRIHFELTVLDEEFQTVKSNKSISMLKGFQPDIINFVALKSGNYILNYNRIFGENNENIVVKLNADLVPIWETKFPQAKYLQSDFFENAHGEIQTASLNTLGQAPPNYSGIIFFMNEPTFLKVALIGSGGEILLDSQYYVPSHHTSPIGISHIEEAVLFNFITNDEHIQQYVSVSLDGTQYRQVQLGFNYINHQIIDGYSFGHFPLGVANPLPRRLKTGQGHLIYSEVDKKLQFLEVAEHPVLNWKFPIPLPEFDELLSYRQLFTERGTIIAGVSFRYSGVEYFTLQEFGMDGEVLQ